MTQGSRTDSRSVASSRLNSRAHRWPRLISTWKGTGASMPMRGAREGSGRSRQTGAAACLLDQIAPGSVSPARAWQMCFARAPHASNVSEPMTCGMSARMQPGPGAGLVVPAVATMSATQAAMVTTTAAIAMLRSRPL